MQYCSWVIKNHTFKTTFLVMLPDNQNRSFCRYFPNSGRLSLQSAALVTSKIFEPSGSTQHVCLSSVSLWDSFAFNAFTILFLRLNKL